MAEPFVTCSMACGNAANRKLSMMAVESFRRQTYKNKELLIINNSGLPFDLPDSNIREIFVEKQSVGYLKNIGIENAHGEYVLQWDDDDYHGMNRIKDQMNAGPPCLLKNEIVCNFHTGAAKMVHAGNWSTRGFGGTVLHRQDIPLRYPDLDVGDDTFFVRTINETTTWPDCKGVDNDPCTYVRFFHGGNVCPEKHFVAMRGRVLSDRERLYLANVYWLCNHEKQRCRNVISVKRMLGHLPQTDLECTDFIEKTIHKRSFGKVLEVGSFHGVTTCYFALRNKVTTIGGKDSFAYTPNIEDTLTACGLDAEIIRDDIDSAIQGLLQQGRLFNLIFVRDEVYNPYIDKLLASNGELIIRKPCPSWYGLLSRYNQTVIDDWLIARKVPIKARNRIKST